MTGLDKMISQIQDEAKAEAERRVAEAREEARKLTSQAAAEGAARGDALLGQGGEGAGRGLERVRYSADVRRERTLL